MKEKGINRVAIIGAGLMGYGIGVEYARFGYDVALYNTRQESSDNAMREAKAALDLMSEAGLISPPEAADAYRRLQPTTNLDTAVKSADLVVESVREVLDLKREIFSRLDNLCPPSVILASNTSTLRITDIAANLHHPERVVATH